MSCAAVSRSGREETPLPCVQTAGQGWFQCLGELGRCWSVLERAEEGGRWSEPSPEQSQTAATVLITLTLLSGTARNQDAAA